MDTGKVSEAKLVGSGTPQNNQTKNAMLTIKKINAFLLLEVPKNLLTERFTRLVRVGLLIFILLICNPDSNVFLLRVSGILFILEGWVRLVAALTLLTVFLFAILQLYRSVELCGISNVL